MMSALPAIAVTISIVIVLPGKAVGTTVHPAIDLFPLIDVEKAMPAKVPVAPQATVLVPVTEGPVAFQPARHLVPAVQVGLKVRRVVMITTLIMRGRLGRIQQQKSAGHERYGNDLVHIGLQYISQGTAQR